MYLEKWLSTTFFAGIRSNNSIETLRRMIESAISVHNLFVIEKFINAIS